METKLFSKYLNMEFAVTTSEVAEGGDTILVVSHDSLETVIHDMIPLEQGVMYDYDILINDASHPVIKCTVCDAKGRRVQAIGEASVDSLETEIARKYPVIMAAQRAFDRAAIRYLNFPGKTFSSAENARPVPAQGEYQPATAALNKTEERDRDQSATYGNASVNVNVDGAADVSGPGAVVISIGKYKPQHKTVAQIAADNGGLDWLNYIASKMTEPKDQINAVKAYLASLKK